MDLIDESVLLCSDDAQRTADIPDIVVESPTQLSRRPQQQKRRTFGFASSSELEVSTSSNEVTTSHTIAPNHENVISDEVTESLWHTDNDINGRDDESAASLLSLDDEEDMEVTSRSNTTGIWLATEALPTSMMTSSALPSDLLPTSSTPISKGITATTASTTGSTGTPKSVSVPNSDDEEDSSNDDVASSSKTPTEGQPLTDNDTEHGPPTLNTENENEQSIQQIGAMTDEVDMEDILASTDAVFEQVTDKSTVTVKDILQSLAAEYCHVTFTKAMKGAIRSRLVELITASTQQEEDNDDDDDDDEKEDRHENDNVTNVQSDIGDSDTDESDAVVDSDQEASDDEEFTATTKKARSSKNLKKTKSTGSKSQRKSRPKNPSAASAKLSLRVHAEQRRKRRLEELRVRNEELLLHQNAIDRERAEQIAAKFATNTEELRQERFEQRISLLQKLNHKRINACCAAAPTTTVKTESVEEESISIDFVTMNPPDDSIVDSKLEAHILSKDLVKVVGNMNDDASVDSESDNDDDELEIVGRPSSMKPPNQSTINKGKPPMPPSTGAMALLDLADNNQLTKRHDSKKGMLSPGRSMDQRAVLREKLKERQRSLGNRWLARELGYKTEEEHLEVCLAEENMKRERIYQKEQERIKANERATKKMMNPIEEDDEEGQDNEGNGDGADDDSTEDDEEMAMARELENEDIHDDVNNEIDNEYQDGAGEPFKVKPDCSEMESESAGAPEMHDFSIDGISTSDDARIDDENYVDGLLEGMDSSHNKSSTGEITIKQNSRIPATLNDTCDSNSIRHINSDTLLNTIDETSVDQSITADENDVQENTTRDDNKESVNADRSLVTNDSETPVEEGNIEESKPKGPRNKAWQAMLQRDAEKAKKKKRSQLIEEEADEEEEEEVAGLEDFGFVVHKKNGDEDDEDADLGDFNEDDLEHVVDDLSDDEGDELAGDKARKVMEAKEEKERHKEMLRRMRDGYDGRRGGIAGATGGARGFHRFDQLVAADNREDAKLLGLLNDDEIDSDNEEDGVEKPIDNEEEDEHVLLDKMLKDRFLHRSTIDEENFSDDDADDGNDAANDGDVTANKVDDEEQEQDRLAKRFAKRARMQRLMEVHGHEAEFSESKLIDEDTTLKLELQQMKNGLIRKQSDSTTSNSWQPANSLSTMNNNQLNYKKQKTGPNSVTFATSLLSKGGSLAIALQANRKSNKARTSFVSSSKTAGGTGTSSMSATASSSFQKCIAFNHVVFHSSNSNTASSRSKSTTGNRSTLTSKLPSNATNNNLMGKTTTPSIGMKVSSNQDSLFSKLALSGNQRKRKI